MSLLPTSKPSVDPTQEGDIQVLGVEGDDTTAVLDALGSETARSLFRAIHDDPRTPTALADAIDTSVQNVLYHLGKLEDAELVQVADTQYSEKGREMNVYAPVDNPLVIFVGSEERERSFRDLLARLFGAVGVLVVSSLLFYVWTEGTPFLAQTGAAGPEPEPAIPPGFAFFLGGFLIAVVLVATWYWSDRLDRGRHRVLRNSLLAGRDRTNSRRLLVAGFGLFGLLSAAWLIQGRFDILVVIPMGLDLVQHGLVALGLFAVAIAYWNDGWLVSMSVLFLLISPITLYGVGIALRTGEWSTATGGILFGLTAGLVGAVVLGSVGFLVGAGARRVVGAMGTRQEPAGDG
jgi:DNA-binding transcriptional ArsR family regulator